MTPQQLNKFLHFAIDNKFNILIAGAPGIGKTSIVNQVAKEKNIDVLVNYAVLSDPTDYRGLPYAVNGKAEFLPFGDLRKIIETDKETLWFLDDIAQATAATQASLMSLLLTREINGVKISDKVSIVAATNRKQDKAGVNGMLEPVKSRFVSIVELNVSVNDWVQWGLQNNMPPELISFIKYAPSLIEKFEATKDITNSPSPRTIAHVGKMQNAGLPQELELEAIKGAVGEGMAIEYTSFLKLFRNLPDIDELIAHPTKAIISIKSDVNYAIAGALSYRMNKDNLENILIYLDRLSPEYSVCAIQMGQMKHPEICNTAAYCNWAQKNYKLLGIK